MTQIHLETLTQCQVQPCQHVSLQLSIAKCAPKRRAVCNAIVSSQAPTDMQDADITSDEAKAVAKRERARLKEQARLKKLQLEQLRAQQNMTSESGEASPLWWPQSHSVCQRHDDGRHMMQHDRGDFIWCENVS